MARNIEEFVILLNDKVTTKLKKVGAALDEVDKKAQKSNSTFDRMKKLAATIGAGFIAGQAIKSVITLGVEMEQTRIAFGTFLGTAEKGNAIIAKLNEFANVTPFDNKQVIGAAKSLLAFGIPAEELTPTLKILGDVSAGTGKDLGEMGIIFGQIRSAGRLMGQDLLQLINAGFNPLQQISQKTGKSVAVLKKEMEKGNISFDMVRQSFIDATSEGGQFFNLMEKQSQSVGGRFSTLLGKAQLMGIGIGEALLPAMGAFVDFGLSVIQGGDALGDLITVLASVSAAFIAWNSLTILAAIRVKALAIQQLFLNSALILNPIGAVVAAVALLIGALVLAWRHSETFRGAVMGLWESLKVLGDNLFKIVIEPFKALFDIWDGLVDLFSGKGGGRLLDGIKRLGRSILTMLIQPLLQMTKIFDEMAGTDLSSKLIAATGISDATAGVGKAFGKGFREELASKATGEGLLNIGPKFKPTPLLPEDKFSFGKGGAGGGVQGKDKKIKAGISEIRSAAPKTFNITIEKLIEDFDINTQTLPESAARIKEEVSRALLAAVNDVNVISG